MSLDDKAEKRAHAIDTVARYSGEGRGSAEVDELPWPAKSEVYDRAWLIGTRDRRPSEAEYAAALDYLRGEQ